MVTPFPFPPTPWLWFLGAGVAFIVGVLAFLVASRLLHAQDDKGRKTPGVNR